MPKITKLCLHLLKLCRKNYGLFFLDTVYVDCRSIEEKEQVIKDRNFLLDRKQPHLQTMKAEDLHGFVLFNGNVEVERDRMSAT